MTSIGLFLVILLAALFIPVPSVDSIQCQVCPLRRDEFTGILANSVAGFDHESKEKRAKDEADEQTDIDKETNEERKVRRQEKLDRAKEIRGLVVTEREECEKGDPKFLSACPQTSQACFKETITFTKNASDHDTQVRRSCADQIRFECTKSDSFDKTFSIERCGCDSDDCNGAGRLGSESLGKVFAFTFVAAFIGILNYINHHADK